MLALGIWILIIVLAVAFDVQNKKPGALRQHLLIFAAMGIGGGLLGISTHLHLAKTYQLYDQRGVTVPAAVSNRFIEHRGSGKGSTTHYWIDLRYHNPREQNIVQLRHQTSAGIYETLKPNDRIDVSYLPETPGTVVLRREIDAFRSSKSDLIAALLGIVLGFALLATTIRLARRYRGMSAGLASPPSFPFP